MKSRALRFIACIIILATAASLLTSCKTALIESDYSDSDTNISDTTVSDNSNAKGTAQSTEIWETDRPTPTSERTLTIFKDGEYQVKFIRSDSPTALDSMVYDAIKKLFKDVTGVTPQTETDYGEPYDGPAILIGDTSYAQSQGEIKKLEKNLASAHFIGDNKYVIAYADTNSAFRIIEKIKNNLSEYATAKEITINSSKWNITFIRSLDNGSPTFDATGLISSAELPKFNGSVLTNPLYAGQGSNIYIQKNATVEQFNTFCLDLAGAGFRYYTDNEINENKFATYVTQTQIVHVMYFKVKNEVRIAVDKRGEGKNGFALPSLSGENKYVKTAEPSLTMVEIDNTGYGGGMCFIYKLSNGKFFIVDSGLNKNGSYGSSAQWIYKTLKELAGSEKIVVAGWLITHVHSDHLGGLYDMSQDSNITKNITIEQLIHNEPEDDVTKQLDNLNDNSAKKIWAWMNPITEAFKIKSVIKAHPGQVLHYADAKVTVLASQDISLDLKDELKDSNDVSVVTQIEFNGKKILMLGDAIKKQNAFLAEVYKTALKSDILQVTHHGLNNSGADTAEGDPNSVNQLCAPKIALWPAGYDVPNNRDKFDMSLNWAMNAYLKNNATNYGAKDGNLTFDKDWNVKSAYPAV